MFRKSRIAMLVAGAVFATQAAAVSGSFESPDVAWADEFSSASQITVFNPDGSSYSIIPAGVEIAQLEPVLLTAGTESMPDQLTVFEPDGSVYSYEFTPVLTAWEPMEILVLEEDMSIAPLAVIGEVPVAGPTYVAHFVSPPTYTGLLEEVS